MLHFWKPFALIEESKNMVTLCFVEEDLPVIGYLATELSLEGDELQVCKSIRKHGDIVTWKAKYFPRIEAVGLTFAWSYESCLTLAFSIPEWTSFVKHLPEIQKSLRVESALACPSDMVCVPKPGQLQVFHFRLVDEHNHEVIMESTYPTLSYDACMTEASKMALRFQYNTLLYPPCDIYILTDLLDVPTRGQLLKFASTYLVRRVVAKMRKKCENLGFGFLSDSDILKLSDPHLTAGFLAGMATFVQSELKVPADAWMLIAAETMLQSFTSVDFFKIDHCDAYDVYFNEYVNVRLGFSM